MTEKEFDMLIKRAITEHINDYIPESEIDYTPHKFSKEFENKMNKLMGKSSTTRRITHKKMITYIAVAIVAVSMVTLSVGAVREAFIRFITNIFQTHTDVRSVTDNDTPLDFSDKYEITADISEFKLMSKSEDIFTREYIYQNGHCTIVYNQYIKEYYNVTENTEGYDMEVIDVNDSEGYYIDLPDLYSKRIAWDNGDYVFSSLVRTGNPLIKEEMELQNKIKDLKMEKSRYSENLYEMQDKIRVKYPEEIRISEIINKHNQQDLDTANAAEFIINDEDKKVYPIEIGGVKYTDRKEGGNAIKTALGANIGRIAEGKTVEIGTYRGMKLSVYQNDLTKKIDACLEGQKITIVSSIPKPTAETS